MTVHFIAIGGSAMHNLALALHDLGYHVTGSDDEVFEPSRSRLDAKGLLPHKMGWDSNRIHNGIDAIILGMHARKDNPELLRAQELGLKIFSYPEYLYEQSKNKIRVVIGGSHGKTSITSMILHVLNKNGIDVDFMVGAQLEGFTNMVKITETAKYMILEGDEYLSSPIDRRPKFHLYQPNIALISGIAWDHINVFPTFDNYVDQFRIFIDKIDAEGTLVYCGEDENVKQIAEKSDNPNSKIEYRTPEHSIENGVTSIHYNGKNYAMEIFGIHNLQNLKGAWEVLRLMNLNDEQILTAFQSFTGASKRLELVKRTQGSAVYKDFAHSPSKLKATTAAVKNQFQNRELIACMELHTFSSLNKEFLSHYSGSMDTADRAIVYFSPETLKHKKLPPISIEEVKAGFGNENIEVYSNSAELISMLKNVDWNNKNLLLMTSGNFDGVDIDEFGRNLI
ncbi:MAG: peptidoglycan synthetase [Crocinitomicaceae bacterium]|nr:peptidoglycan synthetase [Crocinitomicaceae bacterium]|tara:strand:- start:9857 stop:11212 length:1356 start_codon:yes stop_codon:yes gene_type:complete